MSAPGRRPPAVAEPVVEAESGRVVRCAIYTRKSTQEGLDMDFNTLDAQREAAEFYIRAMRGEGWVALPDRYDDGGFTGANVERPALQRLLADIDAGRVDCVVVYKVDRLSRSLLDFANLLALFDARNVAFVSTTQHFNTRDAMGRLTLNIVVSFAQFEREMIADRTRDKMAASRRRGKWLGSRPIYGYRGDRDAAKLVIEPDEAERVRAIFALYLRLRSGAAVAAALNEMGWERGTHTTTTGRVFGGGPWDEVHIFDMLRNKQYIGKVVYRGEAYDGEHEGIVDVGLFERVQRLLDARSGGRGLRRCRNLEFILHGVLRCGVCGGTMTSTTSTGRTGTRHRYYACSARLRGAGICGQPRIAADALEDMVVQRLRARCSSDDVREQMAEHMQRVGPALSGRYAEQRQAVDAERQRLRDEAARLLAASPDPGDVVAERLAAIDRRLAELRQAASGVDAKIADIQAASELASQVAQIFAMFDRAWEEFSYHERHDLVRLVIKRVDVNEPEGMLELVYHDLSGELTPDAGELTSGLGAVIGAGLAGEAVRKPPKVRKRAKPSAATVRRAG